jgi:hypothetical protein
MNEFQEAELFFRQVRFFPEDYGYELTGLKLSDSELLGQRLMATYTSRKAKRQVRFYYSPERLGQAACFSMFVTNEAGETAQITEHLKDIEKAKAVQKFCNDSPKLPTSSFQNNFAALISYLAQNDLAKLLSGEEWNVKPFDWSPYR